MSRIQILLTAFVLLISANLFSQNVLVTFRDTTTVTKALVNVEYGTPVGYPNGYPYPTPSTGFNKWFIQFYNSVDNVIDPLDSMGNPTNDDLEVIAINGYSQYLNFGPDGSLVLNGCLITPSNTMYNTWVGSKIYMRIFNSNLKANATKYISLTSLYTVTSSLHEVLNIYPTYAWGPWVTFNALTPIAPVIVSPTNGSTGLNANGQILTWMPGAVSTPACYKVYFGTDNPPSNIINGNIQAGATYATGTLSLLQTYYWKIVPFNVNGEAQNCPIWSFTTSSILCPGVATNPLPVNNTILYDDSYPTTQTLLWTAPIGLPTPIGYKVFIGTDNPPTNITNGNIQTETSTQFTIPINGTYYWKIVPYTADAYSIRDFNTREDAIGCPVWMFTSSFNIPDPALIESPENLALNVSVEGVLLSWSAPETGGTYEGYKIYFGTDNPPTNIVNGSMQSETQYPSGALSFGMTYYWKIVPYNLSNEATGCPVWYFTTESINPPALDSFTAIVTPQHYVMLQWITPSEANLVGFYLFRSYSDDFDSAANISPLIAATNTSTPTTYNYVDMGAQINIPIYYWVQCRDINGTQYNFGPISVVITNSIAPELAETSILNAYPNPFRAGTSARIDVSVKAGETGMLTIYNIRGQQVKTYKVMQGVNSLIWDAKGCGSGIYFYKLSTPTVNVIRKLVITN